MPSRPPRHDPAGCLADIVENAERIERYLAGMDRTAFEADGRTRDAVERCVERVCEAVHRLGDRAERQELLLGRRSCAGGSSWPVWTRGAVVLVQDAGLTRGDQRMFGDQLTGQRLDDTDAPGAGVDDDPLPDQSGRDGVAGRADPHAGQLVDGAEHRTPQARPQRRQRRQQSLTAISTCGANGASSLGRPPDRPLAPSRRLIDRRR